MRNALVRIASSLALVYPISAMAQDPPSIRISHPFAAQVLSSRTFPLLYVLEGELSDSGLDHVHWQLNDSDKPTAPDLSGVDEIAVEEDGEYRLTVWMADKDHGVIGEKAVVSFEVVTFGAQLLSPSSGETVASSNLEIYYTLFGTQPSGAAGVVVQVDDGQPERDDDGDGSVLFRGVENGERAVRIYVADGDGNRLSKTFESRIRVDSKLTLANLGSAKRMARSASVSRSERARRKALSRLRVLLAEMEAGGDLAAGAPALDNSSISRARRMTARALRKLDAVDALVRFLRSLERKAKPKG